MSNDKSYNEMNNDELFDKLAVCFECEHLPECKINEIRAMVIIAQLQDNGMTTAEWRNKIDGLKVKTFNTKPKKYTKIEIR